MRTQAIAALRVRRARGSQAQDRLSEMARRADIGCGESCLSPPGSDAGRKDSARVKIA